MHLSGEFITSLLAATIIRPVCAAYNAKQIFQFPSSPFTSIENVALRPNGQLILTITSSPQVYTLDPSQTSPTAALLHTFTGATSCLGITQTANDKYAIAVGNVSSTTFLGVKGSFSVWSMDLTVNPPQFAEVAAVPQATILNGVTHLTNNPQIILAADSQAGAVYSINMVTGAVATAIQSSTFTPTSSIPLGINGIRTSGSALYYINSAQGTYSMLPLNSNGEAIGPATVIAHDLPGNTYDDFTLNSRKDAFITNHPNSISKVTIRGAIQTTILNATTIMHPTSAVFGLDGNTLYIVTAGEPKNNASGQVFIITSLS